MQRGPCISEDVVGEMGRGEDGLLETLTHRSRELGDAAALLRKSGAIDAGIAP